MLIDPAHRLDQPDMVLGHPHAVTVVRLRFVPVGQTRKNIDDILAFRHPASLLHQGLVGLIGIHPVAFCIRSVQPQFLQLIAGTVQPHRLDLRAARPLVTWVHRKSADHGCFLDGLSWQDIVLVFQEHSRFSRRPPRQGVMRIRIIAQRLAFSGAQDQAGQPHSSLIKGLHRHSPAFHRPHNTRIVCPFQVRHLQVKPGFQALNPVSGGAPIRHHHALKTPFLAQNLAQQALILAGKFAKQPVIRTHHRPWPGFFDRPFKASQVYLA